MSQQPSPDKWDCREALRILSAAILPHHRDLYTQELSRAEVALASFPSSIGLTPKEGHCLLQVPQQTTEKPSPCAMAGYCLNTDAKAMPSARGSSILLEEHYRQCAFDAAHPEYLQAVRNCIGILKAASPQ